ncbi:MAG TPA: secretin N-terminal domain-containing protein [Gemmatimonadaceae bacterium]|nr:secretin N-terminal domain-containing protein [Gemmatimonadaceae bacterium]
MRLSHLSLLLACAATSLGAQRGGRPPTPAPKAGDTTGVRKTPDGFVLDFQDQDLRIVLSAIAEAGGLNVTLANIPPTKATLRMGQAVTKAQALDVLRGVAAANDLKITETPSLIRVEGTPPPRNPAAQQTQQQQGPVFQPLRLYTYRLKHASAVQLAPVLMNLLIGTGTGGGGGRGSAGGNVPAGVTIFGNPVQPGGMVPNQAGRGGAAGAAGAAGGAGGGRGGAPGAAGQTALQQAILQNLQQSFGIPLSQQASDIRIVAEESTNSLLVRATADDWALVQQLLTSVDLRPLQVLIEVTIAQVTRTHDLNVGISGFQTRKTAGAVTDTTLSLPSAASAREFVALLTGGKGTINYSVALNALQTRGDVRVLSLPIIIGQNNKEAVLDVGQNVPFVQVSQTSGIDPTGRVQTIQYQSVGKTLTITPTINPDGYVNLAVKQTNNSVTNAVQFNAPIINKQEATTQVFIRDGQTTVFGGLSDNTKDHSTSGIPFLSRIPLIGWLFGSTVRNDLVSELYLFLTPHIVSSDEDVDRLREAVKGQSELLQDMNVNAKIVPKGDTIHVGDPVRPRPDGAKPKADSARIRPDSTKRPDPL